MFERKYFILASNYHGATLLGKLLNDHPKVMSLGDTYPSNNFDQICGCGEPVSRCEFWQRVGMQVDGERYRSHPHWLPDYPSIRGGSIDRLIYNTLTPEVIGKLLTEEKKKTFGADFAAFTHAVHRYGGRPDVRVFVDGVKSISRVFALIASGVRIDGVIHLQRSPGDFIQSMMKQQGYSRNNFFRQLVNYRLFHNRARRVGHIVPYLALTYEGLSDAPEATLDGVFSFLGVESQPLAKLLEEGQGRPWHFMGNASLFKFDGTVRPSHHRQTRMAKLVTRVLAGPYDVDTLHLTRRST